MKLFERRSGTASKLGLQAGPHCIWLVPTVIGNTNHLVKCTSCSRLIRNKLISQLSQNQEDVDDSIRTANQIHMLKTKPFYLQWLPIGNYR